MSQFDWSRVRDEFRTLVRSIVETVPIKDLAADLGVPPSSLSNAVSGRTSHALHLDWLPVILARALNDEALEFLARIRGKCLVDAPDKLPPEVELQRLKAALHRNLGPEIRRMIENDARAGR